MDFFTKEHRGAVTVFLVIIMLPTFLLGGMTIDFARLEAAKTIVTSAGDLTANAVLSDFQGTLLKDYGILATDGDPSKLNDIASMYFRNMVNSNDELRATDSITQNFIAGIKTKLLNEDNATDFKNIVKMETSGVTVSGVADSVISNPNVLRYQILEYMKYRGPISLLSSVLTKYKAMGSVDKQMDAVDKEMEYEKALSDTGDLLKETYNYINDELNPSITEYYIYDSAHNTPYVGNGRLSFFSNPNDNGNEVSAIISTVSDILAAHHAKENGISSDIAYYSKDFLTPSHLQEIEKAENKEITQENLYKKIRDIFEGDIDFFKVDLCNNSNENAFTGGARYQTLQTFLSAVAIAVRDVPEYNYGYAASATYNRVYKDINYLYFLCETYLNNATEEEKETEEYSYVKNIYEAKLYKDSNGNTSSLYKFITNNSKYTNYIELAQTKIDLLKEELNEYISLVKVVKNKVVATQGKLLDIKEDVKSIDDARAVYGEAVSNLPDSDFQASMQTKYDSSAKDIDIEKINKLIALLESFIPYCEDLVSKLEEISFMGVEIHKGVKLNNIVIDDYAKSSNCTYLKDYFYNKVTPEWSSWKLKLDSRFQVTSLEEKEPFLITSEGDEFYKYLSKICNAPPKDDTAKKENENKVNNSSGIKSTEGTGLNITFGESSGSGESGNGLNLGNIDDKGGNTNQARGFLSNSINLIKSFANLATIFSEPEQSRYGLYEAEYMTEMFSCYTTDMGSNEGTELTLANQPMNDRPYYRAEQEYILIGAGTSDANVNGVKDKIRLVRFGMNFLYAITDSQINNAARTAASFICGGFPFAIPIVQTIIVFIITGAEGEFDLYQLMNGKDVPFLKNKNTFALLPGNWGKNISSLVVDAANNVIDDTLSSITDYLVENESDAVSDLTSSINDYVDQSVTYVFEKVSSLISTTLFNFGASIIEEAQAGIDNLNIDEKINDAITSISGQNMDNEVTKKALNFAIELIPKDNIVLEISIIVLNVTAGLLTPSEAYQALNDVIKSYIKDVETSVKEFVKGEVSNASDSLKSKLTDETVKFIDENGEILKGKTSEAINEVFAEFNKTYDSSNTSGPSNASAGLTLNYKEYLKTFIILECMGETDSPLLERTAKIIEKNIQKKDEKFNLADCYTMIQLDGDVKVGTSFIGFINNDNAGNATVDFKNYKSKVWDVPYQSARGY